MGGFGSDWKERQMAEFVERWAPSDHKLPAVTAENLRYNIAHRRAAEHELAELKRALFVIKDALR